MKQNTPMQWILLYQYNDDKTCRKTLFSYMRRKQIKLNKNNIQVHVYPVNYALIHILTRPNFYTAILYVQLFLHDKRTSSCLMKVSSPCNRNVDTSNRTSRDIDQPSLLDCTTVMKNYLLSTEHPSN